MTRAVVALGSSIRPRRTAVLRGMAALAELPGTQLIATSRLHETAPVDCPPGAGDFINAACLLETGLSPPELLAALQVVERAHGRRRTVRNGPRTLDLDLILHGETMLETRRLVLPHPRAHERLFVLEPAAEVAPAMRHPRLGRTLAELRDELRARRRGAHGEADACGA